MSKMAPKIN